MEVYSKSYLKAIVSTQGELFDNFARRNRQCDTEDFIEAYMNSQTRAHVDAGQAYVCTMNADELMRRFLLVDRYQTKAGDALAGFLPDWIGRFYAYYQWSQKISSAETLKAVPLVYLKSAYQGLHDLDLNLAVAKVARPL